MRRKRYNIKKIVGEDREIHTGLCQYTKYFWRKVVYYAHAPLHKHVDQVSNDTFHKIIDAFGECIYQKIINGGIYRLPCDNFGRLYIRRIDKMQKTRDKQHFVSPSRLQYGSDYFMLKWDKKVFKNNVFANILLRNTKNNIKRYINDTTYSNAIYFDKKVKLRVK